MSDVLSDTELLYLIDAVNRDIPRWDATKFESKSEHVEAIMVVNRIQQVLRGMMENPPVGETVVYPKIDRKSDDEMSLDEATGDRSNALIPEGHPAHPDYSPGSAAIAEMKAYPEKAHIWFGSDKDINCSVCGEWADAPIHHKGTAITLKYILEHGMGRSK